MYMDKNKRPSKQMWQRLPFTVNMDGAEMHTSCLHRVDGTIGLNLSFCRAGQVSLHRGVWVWGKNMGLEIWEENLKKNIDSATSYAKMVCLWWCGVSILHYRTGKNLPQSISQIIKVETDIHTCNTWKFWVHKQNKDFHCILVKKEENKTIIRERAV